VLSHHCPALKRDRATYGEYCFYLHAAVIAESLRIARGANAAQSGQLLI
jgi:hypothetical protein